MADGNASSKPISVATEYHHVIVTLVRIFCAIGMAGNIFSLYAYLQLRVFDLPMARSIVILSGLYFFDSIAKSVGTIAVGGERFGYFCQLIGMLSAITSLASVIWMIYMTTQLVLLIGARWTLDKVKSLDFYLLGFAVGIPTVMSTVFLFLRPAEGGPVFGRAQLWCWVSNKHPNFQMWSFYVALYIALFLVFAAFFYMGFLIFQHRRRKNEQARMFKEEASSRDPLMHFIRGATVYLFVFILSWVPSSLSRWYRFLTDDTSVVLMYMQATFTVLRGVFNTLLFLFLAWSNKKRQDDMTTSMISTIKKRPSLNPETSKV